MKRKIVETQLESQFKENTQLKQYSKIVETQLESQFKENTQLKQYRVFQKNVLIS